MEHYLQAGSADEQQEARRFIERGTCFLAYNDGKTMRFAPSRFIGYQNNTFDKHSSNAERDGRVTNPAISRLLETPLPLADTELEEQYQQYCHSLGITPRPKGSFGVSRKYWRL
ncbi:hypothetical protein [Hymenobacter rubripertinctus]|uniref:hypothetical protein n=1 Tax=Hymenobacter rubripertinctus TaxID=2029981 RepID=UPI0011C3E217|nr:hypothetical protein [Hymenobacter rubripertinctus]